VRADQTELKASEKEVIDRMIEQMSDWSAAAISNYSQFVLLIRFTIPYPKNNFYSFFKSYFSLH